jgi:hypothetical protein
MHTKNVLHLFQSAIRLVPILLLLCSLPARGADVTFAWDANTEADLEGYSLYFKEIPELAYSLYGYVALPELADAANPRFVVSGLEKGKTYYFALTAFNWFGLESAYSNSVCIEVGDIITVCPTSGGESGGADSSGGGGGGGGCFIHSLKSPNVRP